MTAIRIRDFSGIAPRISPSKLPAGMAQRAYNVNPWSGDLRAFKNTYKVATLAKTGTVLSIHLLNDAWLAWDYDANAVPGPVPDDGTYRLYYTGDGQEPRVTNYALATSSGSDFPKDAYTLGIHEPLTGPTVGHTGGSGANEDRSYVYTFLTQWGEESAPSPVGTHTGKVDATSFDLSGMQTAPLNTGSISGATHAGGWVTVTTTAAHWIRDGHRITIASVGGMTDLNGTWKAFRVSATTFKVQLSTAQTYTSGGTWTRVAPYNTTGLKQRIYRTINGKFRFVAEQAAGATYTDTRSNTAVAAEELIPTTDWDMPDGEMIGLILLPNGMMAGFVGNELCFSEPLQPHAWPEKYRRTLPFRIKALGSYGNTIVVATEGWPYRVSGTHPESMQEAEVRDNQPCLAKASLVSFDMGCIFATTSGLYFIGASGHGLVTRDLFLRAQWSTRKPVNQRASLVDNRYVSFYETETGVGYGLILDKREGKDSLVEIGFLATALFNDPSTDDLYLVRKIDGVNEVHKWEGDDTSRLQYLYLGRIDTTEHLTNFAYAMVDAEFGQGKTQEEIDACIMQRADVVDANQDLIDNEATQGSLGEDEVGVIEVSGDIMDAVPSCTADTRWVIFRLYGDGVLRHEETVFNRDPFPLPSGFTAKDWEVEMLGNVDVTEAAIAESIEELAEL